MKRHVKRRKMRKRIGPPQKKTKIEQPNMTMPLKQRRSLTAFTSPTTTTTTTEATKQKNIMVAPSSARIAVPRHPRYLFPCILALVSLTAFFLYKVNNFAAQIKTVAGHNLEPTPWHLFPPKTFDEETWQARAYKLIQCSYLTCQYNKNSTNIDTEESWRLEASRSATECPGFFGFIHNDLKPWAKNGVTVDHVMGAKNYAAYRVVIYGGKLYLDIYYACVQSRMMFTIWGLLQLLNRYPGLVPDVDMMFDCMDKPSINRNEHESFPLPLFRYCTTENHFDIPFPDWSFWGWPEVNIRPWDEEFQDIKRGSQAKRWQKKIPRAYWKGNPDVDSPVRTQLLQCNHSRKWGAQIMRQDWGQEAKAGYESSKLSKQCDYRYKIYAEGYAWSVSLKYIIACGSVSLIISPQYEDFFSRGLIPKQNYWPISLNDLCWSIKFAVDWSNSNPSQARQIGEAGQNLMETLNMDRVYDYMFHLIKEYSRLQKFTPVPPSTALQVCAESLLCLADAKQRQFLDRSIAFPSQSPPCTLRSGTNGDITNWMRKKHQVIDEVRQMERMKT